MSAYDFEVDEIYYDINISNFTAYVTYTDKNYSIYSGNTIIPKSVTYKGQELDII